MQGTIDPVPIRPTVALADYDFLRSTYDILVRAPVPNGAAINAAFEALDAAHKRLTLAHLHCMHDMLPDPCNSSAEHPLSLNSTKTHVRP